MYIFTQTADQPILNLVWSNSFFKNFSRKKKVKCFKIKPIHLILAGAALPLGAEALGTAILSLAEMLTTSYDLNLLEPNPKNFYQAYWMYIFYLLSIAAGTGAFAVSFHEFQEIMNELKKQKVQYTNQLDFIKSIAKSFFRASYYHPLEFISTGLIAIVDWIIVSSNFGYITNQINYSYHNPYFRYTGFGLGFLVATQVSLITYRNLLNLTQNVYVTPHYARATEVPYQMIRVLEIGSVNLLPLLSAGTMATLAIGESYQITQFLTEAFDNQDIADRIAWIPAIVFGIVYGYAHYSLYGLAFKDFLAHSCHKIENIISKHDLKLSIIYLLKAKLYLSDKHVLKKASLYSLILLIVSASMLVGFGSLSEFSNIIFTSDNANLNPPYYSVNPSPLSLKASLLTFAIPVLALGLETYAVEGRKLLEISGIFEKKDKEEKQKLLENVTHDSPEDKENVVSSTYDIRKLLNSTLSVAFIGGLKFIMEWFYLPDSMIDIPLKDVLILSGFMGVIATGREGIIYALDYYKFAKKLKNKINKLNDSIIEYEKVIQQTKSSQSVISQSQTESSSMEIMPASDKKSESHEKEFKDDIEINPKSNCFIYFDLLLTFILTSTVIAATYYFINNLMLNNLTPDDENQRTNNALVLSAITGGLAAVHGKSLVKSTAKNAYNFFKSSSCFKNKNYDTAKDNMAHSI